MSVLPNLGPILTLILLMVVAKMVAAVCAFVILFLGRTGAREYLIIHSPKLFSELIGCDFCLGFWLSVIVSSIIIALSGDTLFMVIPVLATPYIRTLL